MRHRKLALVCWIASSLFLLHSCSIVSFEKKSPHVLYADGLVKTGLNHSALGQLWLQQADESIKKPIEIKLPYQETGYFAMERIRAVAFRFPAQRGEQLTASVRKNAGSRCRLYLDLWKYDVKTMLPGKNVAFADSTDSLIVYEVTESGEYILRLQPELLCSTEYTLTITIGPTLGFPLPLNQKGHFAGFFGDVREGGNRNHEGVDIVAPFGTPVLAVASGIVTAVNENNLGGKAVWFHPAGKDYQVYYAHLDTQMVHTGQFLKQGDTLGLEGKTGNARLTVAHLHFGIYASGGAIDPFPFINRDKKKPPPVTAPLSLLNDTVRTFEKLTKAYPLPNEKQKVVYELPAGTPMLVESATENWYRVILPDHEKVYVRANKIKSAEKSLRTITVSTDQPLFDSPDLLAARKKIIPAGEIVKVIGIFKNYYLIGDAGGATGWMSK